MAFHLPNTNDIPHKKWSIFIASKHIFKGGIYLAVGALCMYKLFFFKVFENQMVLKNLLIQFFWNVTCSLYVGLYKGLVFDSCADSASPRQKRSVSNSTTLSPQNVSYVPDFSIKSALARCRAWSESKKKWVTDVCTVSHVIHTANDFLKARKLLS